MSKHAVAAGNIAGLLEWLAQLKEKARVRTGRDYQIITIQEAGLDGFWIHRVLQSRHIESHVVDPASILTSRRRRRAKTDKIDGETLVRTLLAHKRGEPRVYAMVKVPTPWPRLPSWVRCIAEGVLGQYGGNFAGGLFDIVLAENVPTIVAGAPDQILIRLGFCVSSKQPIV
jgi:hypothetical protein